MKIIFLDIDGVLNTWDYRRRLELEYFSNLIDRDKMIHLKKIVDLTGAKIVLSSSWRKWWNTEGAQTDSVGCYLQQIFRTFDLQIYDKIPVIANASRSEEVWAWMRGKYYIEEYAILDDRADLGWNSDLQMHFIQTSDAEEGLTDALADAAILVLNGELREIADVLPPAQQDRKHTLFQTWLRRLLSKE